LLTDGSLEELLHFRLARDIRAMRKGPATGLRDRPHHLHRRVLAVAVVDDDVRASAAQRDGDGAADPGVCAGDDGFLALQRSGRGHFELLFEDPLGYAPGSSPLHAVTERVSAL